MTMTIPLPPGRLCRERRRRLRRFGLRSRLEDAIGRLNPRERKIIILRFFKGWSQTDVARELNISQMHVSRLQHKALARLREMVESEEV